MGTHPIFESDFDCLTEKMLESTNAQFELLVCTSHLQSSRFVQLERIKNIIDQGERVAVYSDTRQAWEKSAQRAGLAHFAKMVDFRGVAEFAELDYDNDGLDVIGGMIEEEKGRNVILDSIGTLAAVMADTDESRLKLTKFVHRLADSDKHIQIAARPGQTSLSTFLMRSLAHLADRVIMIDPLKTGLANDVTGRIRRITRNGEEEEDLFKLGEKSVERVIRGLIRN